ncbi:MAG: hypothetical protein NkDv07_0287 [Candidatus Improbicoccus devescovinae]|nr:MAG: hypothetical protein NkDv07_0287 [Candidatus Improbicoccus devescovinae]
MRNKKMYQKILAILFLVCICIGLGPMRISATAPATIGKAIYITVYPNAAEACELRPADGVQLVPESQIMRHLGVEDDSLAGWLRPVFAGLGSQDSRSVIIPIIYRKKVPVVMISSVNIGTVHFPLGTEAGEIFDAVLPIFPPTDGGTAVKFAIVWFSPSGQMKSIKDRHEKMPGPEEHPCVFVSQTEAAIDGDAFGHRGIICSLQS